MSSSTRTPTARDPGATEERRRRKKKHSSSHGGSGGGGSSSSSSKQNAFQKELAPRVDANYTSGLRAEVAESKALTLSGDVLRREKDFQALRGELAQADELAAHLEHGLNYQARLLSETRTQLVRSDEHASDLRQAHVKAEQEAEELRLLLKAASTKQAATSSELGRLGKAMNVQGEELRNAAKKIHAQREAESKAFQERRRIWERTVDDWLSAGYNKRIDPIVYNVNKDIFSRLQELLTEEQHQRDAQAALLKHASHAELETVQRSLGARVAELEREQEALFAERSNFNEHLASALTVYLKGELAAKAERVEQLERELRKTHDAVRDLRDLHIQDSRQRVQEMHSALAPVAAQVSSLEQNAAALAAERKLLADDDPRKLIERQQVMIQEAQAEAEKERVAKERMAAELKSEKAAHIVAKQQLEDRAQDLASKSMEFGEKEYYQVTMTHLQELQKAKEEDMAGLSADFETQIRERDAHSSQLGKEVEELRKQRQTMALSLAQYASLEAEWGEKELGTKEAQARLEHENRRLKKKAAKVQSLERKVSELNHDDVQQLKQELQHLKARLTLAEESLASTTQAKLGLQQQIDDMKTEQQTNDWLAKEELADREAGLESQAKKLKEGLALRVLRQWRLRTVARCWKSWTVYTFKRKVRRDIRDGVDADSDDDGISRAPSTVQPKAPKERIADALNGIVGFF